MGELTWTQYPNTLLSVSALILTIFKSESLKWNTRLFHADFLMRENRNSVPLGLSQLRKHFRRSNIYTRRIQM
jgi:hypothetical protein